MRKFNVIFSMILGLFFVLCACADKDAHNVHEDRDGDGVCDVCISAKTGEGLEKLKRKLSEAAVGELSLDKAYIIEQRHYSALIRAADSLKNAIDNISEPPDILSIDLKEAWDALGEITGETANEEIINTVFEKFCVGK